METTLTWNHRKKVSWNTQTSQLVIKGPTFTLATQRHTEWLTGSGKSSASGQAQQSCKMQKLWCLEQRKSAKSVVPRESLQCPQCPESPTALRKPWPRWTAAAKEREVKCPSGWQCSKQLTTSSTKNQRPWSIPSRERIGRQSRSAKGEQGEEVWRKEPELEVHHWSTGFWYREGRIPCERRSRHRTDPRRWLLL